MSTFVAIGVGAVHRRHKQDMGDEFTPLFSPSNTAAL